MKEVWVDESSYDHTGKFNVIKDAWDNQAGWHYELVKSFDTIKEAEAFVENYGNIIESFTEVE